MHDFLTLLWKVDYPLTLLVSFLAFFIPLKKRKNFIIPLVIGLLALFGFWQIRDIRGVNKDSELLLIIFYLGEIGILFATTFFTLEIDLTTALFILQCVLSLQHLSFKVSLQIVNFIDINLYFTIYYFLISYLVLAGFTVLMYFIFSRRLTDYVGFSNIIFNTIAFTLIIAIVIIFSIYEQGIMFQNMENRLLITSLLNFSNIIIILLIIVFLYTTAILQKRKEETMLLSMMAQKERERFELAKITIDEINIKYHDLKHMLQDNKTNINEEDLNEIRKTITNYKAIVHTSNVGLNTAVFESQLKCINLGIDLNVLLDGDVFQGFKAHHIYSLFSNLLDNAIEYVSKYEEVEKKRILLTIKSVRDSIVIIVENYLEKEPTIQNGLPHTSHKDLTRHGFGLKSVKRIVDIYEGLFTIKTDDNKFTVKIVFSKQKQ